MTCCVWCMMYGRPMRLWPGEPKRDDPRWVEWYMGKVGTENLFILLMLVANALMCVFGLVVSIM